MAEKKHEDSKIWAFLGVFLTLIGFLLVVLIRRDDKYAMYYAKQGLVLFIGWVIVAIINVIPVVGMIVYWVGAILLLIAWVVCFVNALSGERRRVAIISDIADKINL